MARSSAQHKLRIAVVSPFLDRRHGTERCVAEQIERLALDFGYEIHIYSQRVEDLEGLEGASVSGVTKHGESVRQELVDGSSEQPSKFRGRLIWRKIPDIPGPHLLRYLWWFCANTARRWWDQRLRGMRYDLVYTPGINCPDADVSAVHIVFGEFRRLAKDELRVSNNPMAFWPRLLHRKLYYRLIVALEKKLYTKQSLALTVVSRQVAEEMRRHYGRDKNVYVLYNAIDGYAFNVQRRLERRAERRRHFGIQDQQIALLLIGNDWKKKGLPRVIEALSLLRGLPLKLMVAGRDDPTPFRLLAERLKASDSLMFLGSSPDVMGFYAAADVYVGPSLHDSFAFPPLEAMASGLPVITSAQNGGSEVITHGVDGFILQDPTDNKEMADLIRLLYGDPALRVRLGETAAATARQYTWDHNAEQLDRVFQEVMRQRNVSSRSVVPMTSRSTNPREMHAG